MKFWRVVAVVLAISPAQAADLGTPSKIGAVTSPCTLKQVSREALCGKLQVPEGDSGRKLTVHFAIIPAADRAARQNDPIVPLLGGPGEGTISAAADLIERLGPVLDDHDLLLVDERGTGDSAPLNCKLYSAEDPAPSFRELFPLARVRQCAATLGKRVNLDRYGLRDFVVDLEKVRRRLGYGSLNVYSASYGTRAAQYLVRAYPNSVRTILFDSTVPADAKTPLQFSDAARNALDRTLEACAADVGCGAAFPDIKIETADLFRRLEAGEVEIALPGGQKVRPAPGRISEWVRSQLYRPAFAVDLPLALRKAFLGDWSMIIEDVLEQAQGGDQALSFGVFFSITCSNDFAFITDEDVPPDSPGTIFGNWRVKHQREVCRAWPVKAVSVADRTPVHSEVPALFVSGDTDPATPLWMTKAVAAGFPNRAEVVMANRGHTEWEPCVSILYEELVRSGRAPRSDPQACQTLERPAFILH